MFITRAGVFVASPTIAHIIIMGVTSHKNEHGLIKFIKFTHGGGEGESRGTGIYTKWMALIGDNGCTSEDD